MVSMFLYGSMLRRNTARLSDEGLMAMTFAPGNISERQIAAVPMNPPASIMTPSKSWGSRSLRLSNSPLKQECATYQSGAPALTQICFPDISRLSKVPLRARISFQYWRGPSRRKGFEWAYHKSASISFISMTASNASQHRVSAGLVKD